MKGAAPLCPVATVYKCHIRHYKLATVGSVPSTRELFLFCCLHVRQPFEPPHAGRDRYFGREALDARSPEKAHHAGRLLKDVLGVLGLRDGTAVTEDQDVRVDGPRGIGKRLHPFSRPLKRQGRASADAALGRQPHVWNQHIGASLGHRFGLLFGEYIRTGQQAEVMGHANHVHLESVAHAGLFQALPKAAINQADCREVLHTAEARRLDLAEEELHHTEGVRPTDAGQHWRVLHDRQDLTGHVHDDAIGIPIGHHAAQAAPAGHAEAAGVIDDDQVDTACLGTLGTDAGAGAAADDRLARGHLTAEPLKTLVAREKAHFAALGYWYNRSPCRPVVYGREPSWPLS